MYNLNLNQITEKLNKEFELGTRKLLFWYDSNADFANDIDDIHLSNATILKIEKDNLFFIKHHLERVDLENSYLLYAPFAKPEIKDNHLSDMILYSKEFFADKLTMLMQDVGIPNEFKSVLEKHIKFFGSKERTEKFYNLEFENFDKQKLQIAMMSVLCGVQRISFEENLRVILQKGDIIDNKYLIEFEKYDLLNAFWDICEQVFGLKDEEKSLENLVITMFVTYTEKVSQNNLTNKYSSQKFGNIIAFIDSLMYNVKYRECFDLLSENVYQILDGKKIFDKMDAEHLVDLEIFYKIDETIIKWLIERLLNEDIGAKLNAKSIPEICKARRKMLYGDRYYSHYYIIENAFYIISSLHFEIPKTALEIQEQYVAQDYLVDLRYRYFNYHYDIVTQKSPESNEFLELQTLIENIYTNKFLDKLSYAWNVAFETDRAQSGLIPQHKFFDKFLSNRKERTVVIISDALRYEVGMTLLKRLLEDEKCDAKMYAMQSVVPSYTRFGMSALLPHKEIKMNDDYDILVDGKICYDLPSRETILKSYVENSRAAQFDNIKSVKDAKELTKGQEIVYIYHNQIDARGDKLNTENEVFIACEEAITEIHAMIKRLTSANNTRFLITADHGFIYKRDKLRESDKIGGIAKNDALIGKRYIVSDKKSIDDGVISITIGDVLGNDDRRVVTLPIGSDIFKVAGGGQNFVHGGSSIQEIIIPMIEVKTNKYSMQTKPVSVALLSVIYKITNLNTNIDFIQTEEVSDINKECVYRFLFVDENNEIISNENIHYADKKDKNANSRLFRLKFTFKNISYDRNKKYYLIAIDENGDETIRHMVQIDI